jgi:hypothetical protein
MEEQQERLSKNNVVTQIPLFEIHAESAVISGEWLWFVS